MNLTDRINAILVNPEFDILHKQGTLEKTKRSYAFWFLAVIDSPKGSIKYKQAKRQLANKRDALINEHLAVITRIGISKSAN